MLTLCTKRRYRKAYSSVQYQQTALMMAAQMGSLDAVKVLMELNANVNEKDSVCHEIEIILNTTYFHVLNKSVSTFISLFISLSKQVNYLLRDATQYMVASDELHELSFIMPMEVEPQERRLNV